MKDLEQDLGRHNLIGRRELIFRYGSGLVLAALVGCDNPQVQRIEEDLTSQDQRPVGIFSESTVLPSATPLSTPSLVVTSTVDKISPQETSTPGVDEGKFVAEKGDNLTFAPTATLEPKLPQPVATPMPRPVVVNIPENTATPRATPEGFVYKVNKELSQLMFVRINEERRKLGLPDVVINENLTSAEEWYVRFLSETNQYGHNLDGTMQERVKKFGYSGYVVSEVLTGSSITRENSRFDAVIRWMNSPPHKEVILRPGRWEVGPACFQGRNYADRPPGAFYGLDFATCGVLFGTPVWPPRE